MYGRKEAPISLGSVAVGGDKEPEKKTGGTEHQRTTRTNTAAIKLAVKSQGCQHFLLQRVEGYAHLGFNSLKPVSIIE